MVALPPGRFVMGSSDADTARDIKGLSGLSAWVARVIRMPREHPDHLVTIEQTFAIGKYLVTRGEFAAFVGETGYAIPSGHCLIAIGNNVKQLSGGGWQNPGFAQTDRDPVVCVSWRDAQAYIAWLNSKVHRTEPVSSTGGPYFLPSEAEWEYAARAGMNTAYWWGDSIGINNAVCDGCGSQWDNKRTAPVGSFRPNPFGLYDMAGNVWEWMADCWNANYTGAPRDGSAWMTGDCGQHALRGGEWRGEPWHLRSASRTRSSSDESASFVGFRVARVLQ